MMLPPLSHPTQPVFSSSPALPSTMATSLPIMSSRPSQRPKLTVNTHQPRVFGKAASLRLDTLSAASPTVRNRSEEHTSELQSHVNLVCRLLLEKKKNK